MRVDLGNVTDVEPAVTGDISTFKGIVIVGYLGGLDPAIDPGHITHIDLAVLADIPIGIQRCIDVDVAGHGVVGVCPGWMTILGHQ